MSHLLDVEPPPSPCVVRKLVVQELAVCRRVVSMGALTLGVKIAVQKFVYSNETAVYHLLTLLGSPFWVVEWNIKNYREPRLPVVCTRSGV